MKERAEGSGSRASRRAKQSGEEREEGVQRERVREKEEETNPMLPKI
jgi:hypothetical protein